MRLSKGTADECVHVARQLRSGLDGLSYKQVSNVFARLLMESDVPTMTLELLVDSFWGMWINSFVVDDMNSVYQFMVDSNLLTKTPHGVYYIPADMKVVVYTGHYNFLFIWDDDNFHVRRFWDAWTDEQEEESEDPATYSDNFGAITDIKRPDLEWYKKRNFACEGRQDAGYVGTCNSDKNSVDKSVDSHVLLKIALACYVPVMVKSLLNRDPVANFGKNSD